MIKRTLFVIAILFMMSETGFSQAFVKTSELFKTAGNRNAGELIINQDPATDTLITRFILGNSYLKGGIDGYRIQIYRSSARTAREESGKARAGFITSFPDIPSYSEYADPGYFIVKVGDFRTKMDGTKSLYAIRKKYPNAYMVPSIINIPAQEKK
jgi:hypothetical protein